MHGMRPDADVRVRHHCIDLEDCLNMDLGDSSTCGIRSVIHSLLTVPHHVQDDDGVPKLALSDEMSDSKLSPQKLREAQCLSKAFHTFAEFMNL